MDNVERLMEFGLTRHEASLYILLTLEGSLNGYEAAKQSGISRSNAYNALVQPIYKKKIQFVIHRLRSKNSAAIRLDIWNRRRQS